MTTLNTLYPVIDIEHQIVYENERSFLAEVDSLIYLINKSDNVVIVMDYDYKSQLNHMVISIFKNNILVNSLNVKHIFISQSINYTPEGIKEDRWKMYVDFLEHYYLNDCVLHLGEHINDQIKHFMKSVAYYKVNLNFLQEHGKQVLNTIEIEDNVYNFKYHAIVRDGLVYFTMMFNDDPEREEFIKSKFDLQAYNHYEAAGGYVIDFFNGSLFIAETHYDPYHQHYEVKSVRYTESAVVPNVEILKERPEYDVNFIFDFIYDTVMIHYPKYSFTEQLIELSILTEGEALTHEHMKLYDMAII